MGGDRDVELADTVVAIDPGGVWRCTTVTVGAGYPDQVLTVYTTEPGSADETSLRLLANWHDGERHHSTITIQR